MAYHELPLPPGLPTDEQEFIRKQIEPYLMDVHALLRLPIDVDGFRGECGGNFGAAELLLAVVSGVSVTLYDPTALDSQAPISGDRFKKVLKDRYPWDQEPQIQVPKLKDEAPEHLWRLFRNPLSHAFGAMGPARSKKYNPEGWGIVIEKGAISEAHIEADERATTRPSDGDDWKTKTTLREEGGKLVLWVRSFYWGVRQMVVNVAVDRAGSKGGISFIAPNFTERRTT
jgi:hypothetical protein